MAVFDFIVTVNLFVFVYPLFVAVIVHAADIRGREVGLELTASYKIDTENYKARTQDGADKGLAQLTTEGHDFYAIDIKQNSAQHSLRLDDQGGSSNIVVALKGIGKDQALERLVAALQPAYTKRADSIDDEVARLKASIPGGPTAGLSEKDFRKLAAEGLETHYSINLFMSGAYSLIGMINSFLCYTKTPIRCRMSFLPS